MAFKKGDIVQLKSGGPKMTIEEDFGSQVRVVWFAGSKMESKVVEIAALQPVQSDPAK